MTRRYQALVNAETGPGVIVIHADAVTPDGELLWFRNENRIVGCVPLKRMYGLLMDRVDLRVGGKPRSF